MSGGSTRRAQARRRHSFRVFRSPGGYHPVANRSSVVFRPRRWRRLCSQRGRRCDVPPQDGIMAEDSRRHGSVCTLLEKNQLSLIVHPTCHHRLNLFHPYATDGDSAVHLVALTFRVSHRLTLHPRTLPATVLEVCATAGRGQLRPLVDLFGASLGMAPCIHTPFANASVLRKATLSLWTGDCPVPEFEEIKYPSTISFLFLLPFPFQVCFPHMTLAR